MDFTPRSNRPPPRTPATIEAELRRRLRAEIGEARAAAEGDLTDDALAALIARAIAASLAWHLEAPEHARGPRTTGTWRPAPGPRGRPAPEWEREEREEEEGPFGPRRRPPFPPRRGPPRREPPAPRGGGPGFGPRRPRPPDEGFDERPRPGPRPTGRRPPPPRGGGFGPRRPRRGP